MKDILLNLLTMPCARVGSWASHNLVGLAVPELELLQNLFAS